MNSPLTVYHYAWFSEELARSYVSEGIFVHSFKTTDGKWVKMTHKSQDGKFIPNPIYKTKGYQKYINPSELQFMGILEFPLIIRNNFFTIL